MGLDVSHDAFHGAYSAFNRFRQAVARATGGSWPPHGENVVVGAGAEHRWWFGDGYDSGSHPGLFAFFMHSDCDGDIGPETAGSLADEMEALLPALDAMGLGEGHIAREGGYGPVARKFIAGCRDAHERGEALVFA